MRKTKVHLPDQKIADFCKKNHIPFRKIKKSEKAKTHGAGNKRTKKLFY